MSFKRRQQTNVEILEIFLNSDNESEYESQESDSDSDSEELPPNLVAIENPESEDSLSTDEVLGPFEDAGGDGGRPTVDEVQEFCGSWKAASHFTPPGPAVSPLLALLFALMSPSLECNAPCHFQLRQSASSCF